MLDLLKGLVPPEIGQAERADIARGYLNFLDERYRYLEFKGMGVNINLPLRMPLLELYVPLQARRTLPQGDAWSDDLRVRAAEVAVAIPESSALRQRPDSCVSSSHGRSCRRRVR